MTNRPMYLSRYARYGALGLSLIERWRCDGGEQRWHTTAPFRKAVGREETRRNEAVGEAQTWRTREEAPADLR